MTNYFKDTFKFKNDTQKLMFEVVVSLTPAIAYKVFTFGFLGLLSFLTLVITAILTERAISKILKVEDNILDFSSIITAILLFLALSCNMSIFVYIIASFVSIGLGKMVYGGFAKNIFNPAMVGWCFVMISFPQFMTKHVDYSLSLNLEQSLNIFLGLSNVDSITQATPLTQYKTLFSNFTEVSEILITNILILLGGLYLIARKIISYIFPVFMFIGVLFSLYVFNYDITKSIEVFILYGPFILAVFYIITDPVSSPSIPKAQAAYSFLIGFISILIAKFGVFPVGIAFAVLFMNSFNFILDKIFNKGFK